MRIGPALKWAAGGIILWLVDSFLLMLVSGGTFESALWSGASPGRLLLRLLVVAIFFFPALNHTLRRAERKRIFGKSWSVAHAGDLWYGAPESPEKSKRLLFYSLRLATALRLSHYEQDKLRRLCYCYDLGMFVLPAEREQAADWERHIQLGVQIAKQFRALEGIAPLIQAHEEYYNGSGYYSLAGNRIPLQCRILQVVLMFDHACGSKRPKRRAALEEALDELNYYAGSVLDPELVRLFQRLMRHPHLEQEEQEQLYTMR